MEAKATPSFWSSQKGPEAGGPSPPSTGAEAQREPGHSVLMLQQGLSCWALSLLRREQASRPGPRWACHSQNTAASKQGMSRTVLGGEASVLMSGLRAEV